MGLALRWQVVLATNIAESSITIPDVTTVLDFCLCRSMEYNDVRGIPALVLQHISQVRALSNRFFCAIQLDYLP